jgi:hypothetical protein
MRHSRTIIAGIGAAAMAVSGIGRKTAMSNRYARILAAGGAAPPTTLRRAW